MSKPDHAGGPVDRIELLGAIIDDERVRLIHIKTARHILKRYFRQRLVCADAGRLFRDDLGIRLIHGRRDQTDALRQLSSRGPQTHGPGRPPGPTPCPLRMFLLLCLWL